MEIISDKLMYLPPLHGSLHVNTLQVSLANFSLTGYYSIDFQQQQNDHTLSTNNNNQLSTCTHEGGGGKHMYT